jgi:hypothetical protein
MKLSATMIPILFLLPWPESQQQQQPPKASIEGTIVRAGSAEPIAGARVVLTRAPARIPAGTTLSVASDAQGKFLVRDLEAGSYRLTIVANGYARQEYGQRVPGRPGTVINLVPGQTARDVVVRLIPTGNVAGRINDENAQPAVGVQVQLLRVTYNANGERTFQSGGQTRTNDRGEYRLFWVTPGRYYLNAGRRAGPILPIGSGVGDSLNGVQETYASAFYPGVSDPERASPIEVQSGVEVTGIDLTVRREELRHVRGRVIDSATRRPPARVLLMLSFRGTGLGGITQNMTQSYNAADGTFELRDIASGTYAIAVQIPENNEPAPVLMGPFSPSRPTATAVVTVSDSDVDGIVLTPTPGVPLPGRLIIEGQDISTVSGLDRLRVQLSNPDVLAAGPQQQNPQAQPVSADGTFVEENTLPGRYRVAVTPLPPDLYIKEARFNQIDVLNKPLEFSGTVSTPLEIVLSARGGQVEGTVTNDKLQAVAGIDVVLIPDQRRDRIDLYKTVVTDQAGHFTIRGIAPGGYTIYAWEALEPFAYFDSDLLRQSAAQGRAVRISESGKVNVDVQLIPSEP